MKFFVSVKEAVNEAVSVRAGCFFLRSIVSLSSGSGDQAMA